MKTLMKKLTQTNRKMTDTTRRMKATEGYCELCYIARVLLPRLAILLLLVAVALRLFGWAW
jgi:hypothetical protein